MNDINIKVIDNILSQYINNYDYKKKFLISIEGSDKSGKTTFIKDYKQYLNNDNIKFIKFPRNDKVNIPNIIKQYNSLTNAENHIELYKMFHDDIYSFNYEPFIYIIDRYYLSSIVYSLLRNVNIDKIINYNNYHRIDYPDIIIYFDNYFERYQNECEFDNIESIKKQKIIYKEEIDKLINNNTYIYLLQDYNNIYILKYNLK